MFQTGDAGCLCFKSFTLEDDFIWKKVCGIDVHLINSGDHPQHCEVNPWRSHLLRLVIWDCTPSVYVALELPGVHSWTLPAEQHASVQVSKGCLLFPVHNGTNVHEKQEYSVQLCKSRRCGPSRGGTGLPGSWEVKVWQANHLPACTACLGMCTLWPHFWGSLHRLPYKQARKARRCDSYLQIWNYQWLTDPLSHWQG